jgi:hypothetical protein
MNRFQLITVIIFGAIIFPLAFMTFASGSWYHPSNDPLDCRKCHEKIYEEFVSNVGAHKNFTCNDCHLNSENTYSLPISFNLTWLESDVDEPHAAVSTRCVDCHSEPTKRLENNSEAHSRFYLESLNLSVSPSSTCIACHTHADVNLTWQQPTHLNIVVNKSNITVH